MATWIDTDDLPYGVGPDTFVAPRAAVQGALFSSLVFKGRNVRPMYTQPTVVAEYGHVKVWQTIGEQLDQGDADVYLEMARMAVEQLDPQSQLVEVRVHADAFLKRLGRERGTESRKWLASCISRLKRASFMFEVPGLQEWETSFLWDFERNYETKVASEYVIQMNPKIIKVYAAGKTLIKASERLALHQDTLAKSLHSFFSSHDKRQESTISVDKLMALTGRKSMRKDRFITGLMDSIKHLKEVTGWSMTLTGEILRVKQTATAKDAPKSVPAAKKKAAKVAAPAAAKPEVVAKQANWDDIKTEADLAKLDIGPLLRLMDAQSKALYESMKPADALDREGMKRAALEAMEDQLYIERDKRAYAAQKQLDWGDSDDI